MIGNLSLSVKSNVHQELQMSCPTIDVYFAISVPFLRCQSFHIREIIPSQKFAPVFFHKRCNALLDVSWNDDGNGQMLDLTLVATPLRILFEI